MNNSFNQFSRLHEADSLFILPNVWNPKSALVFEQKGFPAVGTSSSAVANSLGYNDGEVMPFEEYLFIVKRILAVIKIPLTVDMEMGYGKTPDQIFKNIQLLVEAGVAGINIEDSEIISSKRQLKHAEEFASVLTKVKAKLTAAKHDLFINVRCDTFILNVDNKLEETMKRLPLYEEAGANGMFLPCISDTSDIAAVTSKCKLPLNVMCIPGLPDFDTLDKLLVKRVSMGPFLFNKIYHYSTELVDIIRQQKNFSSILS